MLTLRRLAVDTYRENIAFLSRDATAYRASDFQALKKIAIKGADRSLLATILIVDDPSLLAADELGLSSVAFRRFGLAEGTSVTIAQATPPRSLDHVRRKIAGEVLTGSEIAAIVGDIAGHRYSEMEIAAFLVASARFMTTDEMLAMTRAMADCGTRLDWNGGLVVDKHCIGGIPGNRTSMIVTPIVAAHGLIMPKTSSRAITSPAGTADTMEVIARVDLTVAEMRAVVEDHHGCLVWGGHVDLSPADDVLVTVERPLGIDPPEQLVASILSKKLAAGVSHLLLDIPTGPTAKVRSRTAAIRLRKMFEHIGDLTGVAVTVALTDGTQPIGRGVGPVLEARDALSVLRGDGDAPPDLRDRALYLAGKVLDFDPALRGGAGQQRARELLDSGAALAALERIAAAQGPPPAHYPLGTLVAEVPAPADGIVVAIDCHRIARIARLAGAPADKGAGIDLVHKVGDRVRRGEPLYRIHAAIQAPFDFATAMADEASGYAIGGGVPA